MCFRFGFAGLGFAGICGWLRFDRCLWDMIMDLLVCCGGCLMFVGWVAFLVGVIVDCLLFIGSW